MRFHNRPPRIHLGASSVSSPALCLLPSMRLFFGILLPVLLALHPDSAAHAAFPFRAPFSFSTTSNSPSPLPSATTSAPTFPVSHVPSSDHSEIQSSPARSRKFDSNFPHDNNTSNPFNASAPLCAHVLPPDTSSLSISLPLDRRVASLLALLLTPAGTCTATVIERQYLLTAAHCLRNFNASASRDEYRILFPSFNAPQSSPVRFRVDGGRVSDFKRHPRYRDLLATSGHNRGADRFVQYDVAWLRLETPRAEMTQATTEMDVVGTQTGFVVLNARDDVPAAGSTVRAAGFPTYGRYSADYSVNNSHQGNNEDDDDDLESKRYAARQTDLAVSTDPQYTCAFGRGYNATTQICVGFGERGYEDDGFPKVREAHYAIRSSCYPCGLDAGGPLFQYAPGPSGSSTAVPVLVGLIATGDTFSSYCPIPFGHIRLSSLLSDRTVDFLPDDFTDGLTLVVGDTPGADLPTQTEFSLEAGGVQIFDDDDGGMCGPYQDELEVVRGELRRWHIAAILLTCTTGGLLLVLVALGCGLVVRMRRGRVGRRPAQ